MTETPAVTKTGARIGRPPMHIDADKVHDLASKACSIEEIAARLRKDAGGQGPSSKTLKRRLASDPTLNELHADGAALGKALLRSRMYEIAFQSANLSVAERMCEFLAMNWLGMTNGRGTNVEVKTTVEINSARDRVTRKLDTLAERIARRVDGVIAASGAQAVPGQPVG